MIAFWQNGDGAYRTTTHGLTEEQVAFLQTLVPGDRLVLFVAKYKDYETQPDVKLTKVEPRRGL